MLLLKKIFITLIVIFLTANYSYAKGGSGRAAISVGRAIVKSGAIKKAPAINIGKNLPSSSVTGKIAQKNVEKPGQMLIKVILFSVITKCVSDRESDCLEGITPNNFGTSSPEEYNRE